MQKNAEFLQKNADIRKIKEVLVLKVTFSETTYVVYRPLKSPPPRSELRGLRVANFGDIIEIAIVFIKKTFKDSKKLKELEMMC